MRFYDSKMKEKRRMTHTEMWKWKTENQYEEEKKMKKELYPNSSRHTDDEIPTTTETKYTVPKEEVK